MGWETRGTGRYYYRKVRCGDRVVSEYVGTGKVGALVALLAEAKREEAECRREVERQSIQQAIALEQADFHRHKGQWRRWRIVNAKH